ncbi:hypothetical protein DL96DRAFT_1810646 [Flagelloscypha sp. PMI_526]|nr:hypothetical protein DL96DRAFT_1810646 [Flagelloscypha sp. PMI_526]
MAVLFKSIALVAVTVNVAALCMQATPAVDVSDKSLPGDRYSNPADQWAFGGFPTCKKAQGRTKGRHFLHAREQLFFLKSDQSQKQVGNMVNLVANNPGRNSIIYKPTDGRWPGSDQPAIIKCLKKSAGYIKERDNTKLADSLKIYPQPQFIDSGEQLNDDCKPTGTMCIVLRDLTASNPPLIDLDGFARSKGPGAACRNVYDTALPVALNKVRELGTKGYIHGDLDTTNMFFSQDLTSVEFIDWDKLENGDAQEVQKIINALTVVFAATKQMNCG